MQTARILDQKVMILKDGNRCPLGATTPGLAPRRELGRQGEATT